MFITLNEVFLWPIQCLGTVFDLSTTHIQGMTNNSLKAFGHTKSPNSLHKTFLWMVLKNDIVLNHFSLPIVQEILNSTYQLPVPTGTGFFLLRLVIVLATRNTFFQNKFFNPA
jgi:hypothetical protein